MSAPITGLIAYWKFAAADETGDYTGNYNLTKTGAPTLGTDRLGNSASFSGFSLSNYFSNGTILDSGYSAWTFFAWMKVPNGAGTFDWVISKANTGPGIPFEIYLPGNGKINYQWSNNGNSNTCASATSVNTGNWFLLVISGDNSARSSLSMNLNGGTAEGTVSGIGPNSGEIYASTETNFTIGQRSYANSNPMNGSIGECGFFDRVLTADEKSRLYTEGASQYIVPGVTNGTVTNNGAGMMAFF